MKEHILPHGRGNVFGIVTAFLMGIIFFVSLSFAPVVLIVPVIITAVTVSSGWLIGALAAASCMLQSHLMLGAPGITLLAVFAVFCVPGFAAAALSRRAKNFFTGMGITVGIQFLMIMAVVVSVSLAYPGDIVSTFLTEISAYIKKQPLSSLVPALRMLNDLGLLSLQSGYISPMNVPAIIDRMIASYEILFRESLPSWILQSSVVTGMLSYLWAVWIGVRRGIPDLAYRPPSTWRVPAHAIIGMPLCMLLTYALYRNGSPSMEMVYRVLYTLTSLMFQIQGVCAVDRNYKRRGMKRERRMLAIGFMIALVPQLMTLLGIYSALFGSFGLISVYIKRKIDQNKEDE